MEDAGSVPTPAPGEASPAPDTIPAVPPEPRKGRRKRPHPYAAEASPEAETRLDPKTVALRWLGLATLLALGGYLVAREWSSYGGISPWAGWEHATWWPLFGGLALLAVSLLRRPWAPKLAIAGWTLFAAYWGLTALDLYAKEDQDIVNFTFAVVGVYFFVYLGYHQWLDTVRGVRNATVRFLHVSTVVAAGSYFLIDKIQPIRLWLIHAVSNQTKWMLNLFGQGDKAGLRFVIDAADNKSPTTFFYPDRYCNPNHINAETGLRDAVGDYCASLPPDQQYVTTYLDQLHPPANWLDSLLQYQPDGDLQIVPVSIILACTALQSIMLFVGLFMGTTATFRRKVEASLVVGAIVYVLNLVRNTGIIWFYGQGHASFWIMHNAIGKGGSLLAMVAIAFGVFRYFPEFFHALVGVLELPDRDGPLERFLRIGKRRPTTPDAPTAR